MIRFILKSVLTCLGWLDCSGRGEARGSSNPDSVRLITEVEEDGFDLKTTKMERGSAASIGS